MNKLTCSFFVCPQSRTKHCCADCNDFDCTDRCLNDPKRCALCDQYPRPVLRAYEDASDDSLD